MVLERNDLALTLGLPWVLLSQQPLCGSLECLPYCFFWLTWAFLMSCLANSPILFNSLNIVSFHTLTQWWLLVVQECKKLKQMVFWHLAHTVNRRARCHLFLINRPHPIFVNHMPARSCIILLLARDCKSGASAVLCVTVADINSRKLLLPWEIVESYLETDTICEFFDSALVPMPAGPSTATEVSTVSFK